MGVSSEAARVGDALRLRAGAETHARAEERAIDGDPDEGDDVRLQARDHAREAGAARFEFVGRELGGRAGRARADVGEREATRRQAYVVFVRERLRHELRGVEQSPERIPRAGEVMADFGRAQRRIDADEEDARPRAEKGWQAAHHDHAICVKQSRCRMSSTPGKIFPCRIS